MGGVRLIYDFFTTWCYKGELYELLDKMELSSMGELHGDYN